MLLSIGLRAAAQSTQADIGARLLNKPLYLRGSWQDKKLKFDAGGNILGKCTVPAAKDCSASFTLSGIDVQSVELTPGELVLKCVRAWLELEPTTRIPLRDAVSVEIAAPSTGDYGPALSKIFAIDLADLTPSLPALWQPYARRIFLRQQPPPWQPHTGGRVIEPVLQNQVSPEVPAAALRMSYAASVLVHFTVGTDGRPRDIQALRPAGLGLDEAAADAVSKWRFKPAMQDGVPVDYGMNIEVRFQ